jgi:hypothetical protein
MRDEVARLIGDDAGQVRYYEICQTCNCGIITMGQARTTVLNAVYIA